MNPESHPFERFPIVLRLWALLFKHLPLCPGPLSRLGPLARFSSSTTPPCSACNSVTCHPLLALWSGLATFMFHLALAQDAALFLPSSLLAGSFRIPDLVIASFAIILLPPWRKVPPGDYDQWRDSEPLLWSLGPCLIYQPGTETVVVLVCQRCHNKVPQSKWLIQQKFTSSEL